MLRDHMGPQHGCKHQIHRSMHSAWGPPEPYRALSMQRGYRIEYKIPYSQCHSLCRWTASTSVNVEGAAAYIFPYPAACRRSTSVSTRAFTRIGPARHGVALPSQTSKQVKPPRMKQRVAGTEPCHRRAPRMHPHGQDRYSNAEKHRTASYQEAMTHPSCKFRLLQHGYGKSAFCKQSCGESWGLMYPAHCPGWDCIARASCFRHARPNSIC